MRRWGWALVVALALLAGCDDAPTDPAPTPAPRIDDLAVAKESLRDGCPKPSKHLPFAPQGRLPSGATMVRLCDGWDEVKFPDATLDVAPPQEAIVVRPDRLVDAVNASEPPEPAPPGQRTYCSDDAGPTLDFWFGYPGDRVAAVRWHDYGCALLETGAPADVAGGHDLLRTFASLLARQRDAQDWRWKPHPPPSCNPTSQPASPLAAKDLPPLATVRYCSLDAHNRWRQAVVPKRLVARINREMTNKPGGRCPVDRTRSTMFRGLTTHDDPVEMWWAKCGWTIPAGRGSGHASWQPSPGLARSLDRLPLSRPFPQRNVAGRAVGQVS